MLIELSNYDGYFINESGIIVNSDGALIRYSADNNGNLYSTLNGNIEYIDRLVAKTFVPNPHKLKYVNHRDNDPMNCHSSNLYWSDDNKSEFYELENRSHREYVGASPIQYVYQVFNDDESVVIECIGRSEVAKLIQYEEISLKNMVGNGRKITLGPYKGFMIRRLNIRKKVDDYDG